MAIKITSSNKKLEGTFVGNIKFTKGIAEVTDKKDYQKAIVFAERSGLEWEDTSVKEVDKKEDKKAPAKKK